MSTFGPKRRSDLLCAGLAWRVLFLWGVRVRAKPFAAYVVCLNLPRVRSRVRRKLKNDHSQVRTYLVLHCALLRQVRLMSITTISYPKILRNCVAIDVSIEVVTSAKQFVMSCLTSFCVVCFSKLHTKTTLGETIVHQLCLWFSTVHRQCSKTPLLCQLPRHGIIIATVTYISRILIRF